MNRQKEHFPSTETGPKEICDAASDNEGELGAVEASGFAADADSGICNASARIQASDFTDTEKKARDRLLRRLRQLDGSWFEEAKIIMELRDKRLYREGYATFEEFCVNGLGMTRANINRRIRTGEIATFLETNVSRPSKESHIRPLLKLSDRAQQAACYKAAVEASRRKKRPLRASDVSKAVKAVFRSQTMTGTQTDEVRRSTQKRALLRKLNNEFGDRLQQEDAPLLECILRLLPKWQQQLIQAAHQEIDASPTSTLKLGSLSN